MMQYLGCLILFVALCLCQQTEAQGRLASFAKKLGTKLDSMAVKGLDRRYIDAPQCPWQLILKGNVSQTVVSMAAQGDMAGRHFTAKGLRLRDEHSRADGGPDVLQRRCPLRGVG